MFNDQKVDYPQNEAGKPEFASITIHLDPALANAETDDVVQKFVLATDTPIEALAKIAPHFGEPTLLAQPKNAQLLVEAGRAQDPVFVYLTPRDGHTVIITSTPTWDMLVQHPSFGQSSALLASEKVQELVAKVMGDLQQFAGGFSSLLMLDLSPDQVAAGEQQPGYHDEGNQPVGENVRQQQDEQGSASSDGGPGTDAEHLRDTADIEQV